MTQDNGGAATDMDGYVYPGDRFTQSGLKSGHGMGMSLRDWFAGQALAEAMKDTYGLDWGKWNTNWPNNVAARAYAIADAMLEARSAE